MSLKKGLKGPWRNRNVRCLIKCLLDSGRPTMQVLGICHVILTLNSIVIQAVVFGQNIKSMGSDSIDFFSSPVLGFRLISGKFVVLIKSIESDPID